MKDSQSRKWQITINNPKDSGFTQDVIELGLGEFKSIIYWCMSDEVGEKGTYHTHVYMAFKSAVRFSTLKNKFPTAHIEMARGTSQQNRDYVFKEGKWKDDEKSETNLPETHREFGEMPIEKQGARNDLIELYNMIKSGLSNYEIIEENPSFMFRIDGIERARQTIREDEFKDVFRELEVTYIFGKTGTGKTRDVMEKYGYSSVYRVTDYDNPFDSYKGQDVIVFEEFRSGLKIQDMLNYLDGYPLELPCRYSNKVACFTKVYLITNVELEEQYKGVQLEHPETWNAFLRRIDYVKEYKEKDTIQEYTKNEYFERKISKDSFFDGFVEIPTTQEAISLFDKNY